MVAFWEPGFFLNMTITFRNTFGDRLAFVAYHLPRNPVILLMTIGSLLFLTFTAVVPAARSVRPDLPEFARVLAFVFVEMLLVLLLVAFWSLIIIVTMISRKNKTLICERTITLRDDAFATESQYGRSESRWPIVQKLARTRRHIFIYVNQSSAVVIPRRAFDSSARWDSFYDFCKQRTSGVAKP